MLFFHVFFLEKGRQSSKHNELEFRMSAMGGVWRYDFAFFIAPTPKFIEGFLQTINHWFWTNSLKGPIHLSRAGSMGAVPGQVIRLWVSKFDRPAVGSRVGGGGTSSSLV